MCEFAVFDVDDPSNRIAEDIVKATTKNGSLTVRKVLGESVALENAIILEVDVSKEQMIVSRSPLLGKVSRMTELILRYRNSPSPRLYEEIQAIWKQARADADQVLKSLKRKTQ